MKIAIILAGNLRTFLMNKKGDDTRICDRFMKYIALNNNADIFAVTDTNDFYCNENVHYTKLVDIHTNVLPNGKFTDSDISRSIIVEQIKELGDSFKYFHIEEPFDITTDPKFEIINILATNGVGGCHAGRLLHQFRKLKLAYEAMKQYEKNNNIEYDIILKWRFDNYPEDYLDLQSYDYENNDVYVCGNHCPLIYDWHAFGNRKGMNYCLSLYDYLGSFAHEGIAYHCNYCNNYGNIKQCCPDHNDSSDITLAAEYHLFRVFKDNNIKTKNADSKHGGSPYRYESNIKKYNLIIPIAGKGQRMIDGGYIMPKPLILVGNQHIIDYGLDSIETSQCNIIFIIRRDHVHNYSIDKILQAKYGEDVTFVIAEEDTQGSVSSCYLAKDLICNDIPLIIFCPDIYFEPKFIPSDEIFKNDGFILTFKANSPNYSYVQQDKDNIVTKTAEKIVISDNASVGVYCFKTGKMFLELAETAVSSNLKSKNEFYICPLYNILIANGGVVKTAQVPIMYVMGTPSEMDFFKNAIFPYFLSRSFILCSDHSGFELKEKTKKILTEMSISCIDCGCYSLNDCNYNDYVPQAVEVKKYYPGALVLGFCRSGQGVNICGNKYSEIRGALINSAQSASLAIRHNAANFFAIAAGSTPEDEIKNILQVLLTEKFEGGRHQNRLQGIK